MTKAADKLNTWILLWSLWVLTLLLISSPVFADDEITVPRNSFEVSYAVAEEAVAQALTGKGVADKISAYINGHNAKALFAYTKPTTVEARGLQFDKNTRHWNASLVFIADGEVITAIPAAGRYDEMTEVAVLKREVRMGDVIKDVDVEIRDFAINRTRGDTITDLAALIGKTPLRSISPFRPIHANEVVNPAIVRKDALVQIRYTSPGMEITTSGQAVTAGAKGDVIAVRNVTSKKVVRAVVESSDSVTITAPNQETIALNGDNHAAN